MRLVRVYGARGSHGAVEETAVLQALEGDIPGVRTDRKGSTYGLSCAYLIHRNIFCIAQVVVYLFNLTELS